MTQTIRNPVRWSDIRREMTPAERFFACCLSRGLPCRLEDNTPNKNSIRGEVIRFFAYGGDEFHPVLGSKILLRGAWVQGELDLSFARVPYALLFYRCHFGSVVNVIRAECPALYMSRSHLDKGLKGDGARVGGGIFMRNGFFAGGEVRLVGATIGGNLNCVGGKFSNPGKNALIASHAKVKGGAFLCRKFSADGEVRLIGADIGENLNCADGIFNNGGKRAFSASRIKTGGDIMLNRGFYADGEVRLRGASIGGQLDCAGGHFKNPGDDGRHGQRQYALNAERMSTGGHVYLNKRTPKGEDGPFIADGRVRFANANIGGNFNCKGGQFRHSGKRSAIAAGGLRSRAVFFSEGFSVKGEVALHVAHIGNFVCTGCKPNDKSPTVINLASTKAAAVDDTLESWDPFEFILDGFTYDTFFGEKTPKDKRRLKWLAKRPRTMPSKDGKEEVEVPFSPLPYEQAAKVLFDMGHDNDARNILLKKEREITERKKGGHKMLRWLWGEFAGYGYQPMRRTLSWALAVIAVGWGVFSDANHLKDIVPHQPAILASENYQNAIDKGSLPMKAALEKFPEYPEFNPLAFSADVFIPVFALHQEPFWYPIAGNADAIASLTKNFGLAIGATILALSLLEALAGLLCLCSRLIRCVEWTLSHIRPFVWRTAFLLCLYVLGLDSPKHWYWLEIGFGWILTSLLLLSVTGLLRPRQSSGEKG